MSSQHASSWDPAALSRRKSLDSGSKAYRNDQLNFLRFLCPRLRSNDFYRLTSTALINI